MPDIYDDWLTEARTWPPDDPRWSEGNVAGFVDVFQQLAAQKRAEHGQLRALAAFRDISESWQQALSYVGWRVCGVPDEGPALPGGRLPILSANLLHLVDELRSVNDLAFAHSDEGFDAMQARFSSLRDHVEAARSLLRQMYPLFANLNEAEATAEQALTAPLVEKPCASEAFLPAEAIASAPIIDLSGLDALRFSATKEPSIENQETEAMPALDVVLPSAFSDVSAAGSLLASATLDFPDVASESSDPSVASIQVLESDEISDEAASEVILESSASDALEAATDLQGPSVARGDAVESAEISNVFVEEAVLDSSTLGIPHVPSHSSTPSIARVDGVKSVGMPDRSEAGVIVESSFDPLEVASELRSPSVTNAEARESAETSDISAELDFQHIPSESNDRSAASSDDWQWLDLLICNARSAAQVVMGDDVTDDIEETRSAADTTELTRLFWDCLGKSDIAGGYWFARVIEASGNEPPITPNTVAAMQALNWFASAPSELLRHCSAVADAWDPSEDSARLAVFGSALRMALFAPSVVLTDTTSFGRVLAGTVPAPVLESIIEAVCEYASGYRVLLPENVMSVAGEAQRIDAIAQVTANLRRWLSDAPAKKMQLPEASNVYKSWTLPGGRMHTDALPILNANFDEVEKVAKSAQRWANQYQVEELLNHDYRKLEGIEGLDDIKHGSLLRVLGNAREFADLLKTWCELSVHRGEPSRDPFALKVVALRERLSAAASSVARWLLDLRTNSSDARLAAVRHFQREMSHIYAALLVDFPAVADEKAETGKDWYRNDGDDLDAALLRRLRLIPGLIIDNEDDIDECLTTIGQGLALSILGADSAKRVRHWLARGDFRWVDSYLDAMGDNPISIDLRREAVEHRSDYIRVLRVQIDAAVRDIQQGGVNQWLADAEAERLYRELYDIIPEQELLIPAALRKVAAIRHRSSDALADRLLELGQRWRALHAVLVATGMVASSLKTIESLVRQTLETRDIRAAETLLNEIGAIAEQAETADATMSALLTLSRATTGSALNDFLRLESVLSDWLDTDEPWDCLSEDSRYLPRRIRSGGTSADGKLVPPLSSDRRNEAALALEDWIALRQIRLDTGDVSGQASAEAVQSVARLLAFMGFVLKTHEGPNYAKPDHLLMTVSMSAGHHSPVPLWGSQSDNYSVLVLRNKRPNAIRETLELLRHDKKPLLTFYLGHLDADARRSLASYTRTNEQPILVLDDVLFLFLTSVEGHRLRSFFECAIPFSYTNPYSNIGDAVVPPEMFQGQKRAVELLMDRHGPLFICGGRQLGKSALQRYIERQFDLRHPHSHVWYIDIKRQFNPRERQNAPIFWQILHKRFLEAGIMNAPRTGGRPDIPGLIKQAFINEPALEVTVFFDESDSLLESIILDGRNLWTVLRALIDSTNHRLKVIFAGNYHISRFAALRNQSVTILGSPIEIGPMELAPAADLIEEPLRALGYVIESRAILNILSLTHRHAGLIQLFMHELLAAKYQDSKQSGPPYAITAEDVEKVYAAPDVRKQMRERLDLTLTLDPEYRCLANAMLLDQEGSGDFRVLYSAADLRKKAVGLWRSGVEELTNVDVEARLNEMCTLGIVVRRAGHFRLAGPHLVSLFGDHAKILADIEDLARMPRTPKFNEPAAHGWIGATAGRYSPLTLVQERVLLSTETQVRMLHISSAAGLGEMVEALQTLPRLDSRLADSMVPEEVIGGKEIVGWISKFRAKQPAGSHALLIQKVRIASPGALFRHIDAAVSHCRKARENPRATVQVVFILEPPAGWAWLQNERKMREPIDQMAIGIAQWDLLGIGLRMEELKKIYTPSAVEAVYSATAGWHLLLNRLFGRWRGHDEGHETACRAFSTALGDPSSELSQEFVNGLGLERGQAPERIFRELIELGDSVSIEDALELLDAEAGPAIEFLERYGLIAIRAQEGSKRMFVEPLAARTWTHSSVPRTTIN